MIRLPCPVIAAFCIKLHVRIWAHPAGVGGGGSPCRYLQVLLGDPFAPKHQVVQPEDSWGVRLPQRAGPRSASSC